MNGALAELLAQVRVHGLLQARTRARFVAAHRDVVQRGIDDAPLHEQIDEHVLLSEVMKRSGSGVSMVRMRRSK